MNTIKLHFCFSNRHIASSQNRSFADGVRLKLTPLFDKMNEEADEHAEDTFQSLRAGTSWEGGPDESELAEQALEAGIEHYEDLMFVKGQLMALAAAGLYHLWERTLKSFIIRELSHYGLADNDRAKILRADFPTLRGWLVGMGFPTEQPVLLSDLNLLSLIANVAKHGEGASFEKLVALAPEFVEGPYGAMMGISMTSADGLWITPERFDRLATAVDRFWESLPEWLPVTTGPEQ